MCLIKVDNPKGIELVMAGCRFRIVLHQKRELAIEELVDFSRLICRLIYFKSEFTASHSSGVAAIAVQLAKLAGFSRYEPGKHHSGFTGDGGCGRIG